MLAFFAQLPPCEVGLDACTCANVAAVTLAAKNARIMLAMLVRGTEYQRAA